MAEPYLGEITMFGGNFAPRGWAFCNGQLLAISSNSALFSLLGTTYGGDGRTTFGLPDLRGRVPVHSGNSQGPGVPNVPLGQKSGQYEVTLITANMPAHAHALKNNAYDDSATTGSAEGNVLASSTEHLYAAGPADISTAPNATESIGNNQPFDNRQPYLGINFIIATVGVYPSRS